MKKTFLSIFLCFLIAYICYAFAGQPPQKASLPAGMEGEQMSKNPRVIMETTKGKMIIELYPDKAPITVGNFLGYVDSGFFNGTIFHRVIPGFMVQGGGFGKGLTERMTLSPIKNEADNGLLHERGTVAMARTNIVDSATAQFFVNSVDNPFLNHQNDTPQGFGYCVFGRVVEGMDVVDAISSAPTHTVGYFADVPVDDIEIISIKREGVNK
jgi:cyclophilin family peptidyl-prolyl cis-trans isomerase